MNFEKILLFVSTWGVGFNFGFAVSTFLFKQQQPVYLGFFVISLFLFLIAFDSYTRNRVTKTADVLPLSDKPK